MNRRMLATFICLYGTLITGGCGGDSSHIRTDSQEVARSGEISLETDASFNAVLDGRVAVGQLGAATRMMDGRVVATDRSFARVVFFAPDGQVIDSSGRSGTGPGEFSNPSWIGRCSADTLYVWDPQQSRITVLDGTGKAIRQFPLHHRPNRLACNENGVLAGTVLTDARAEVRMSASSPSLEGAVVLSNAHGDSVSAITGLTVYRNRPLGGLASIALSTTRLYFGFPGSASVNSYSLSGELDTVLAVGDASRPPKRAHYEAAVEEILSIFTIATDRQPFRAEFLAIPMPETLPAYRQILIGPDGVLWAVTSPLGDGRTVLEALDSMGSHIGTVTLPGDFTVSEIGVDYILGIGTTVEGDQRLQVFRMRRQR